MDLAARRPHISAGLALASAAVIAAGPMTQHLPKFDVAQHLPKVSVADINLTDAASGMMDLFAGVEDQLASLASGASAAAVPAAALTDFINPAALPLPLATWVQTFQNAGTNLQTTADLIQALPVPVLQQTAANWLSYGDLYVSTWQAAANAAVKFYTYTGKSTLYFWPLLNAAFNNFAAGKISQAVSQLYSAFFVDPFQEIGEPLEAILKIPAQFTQSLANATEYLTTTGIDDIGIFGILGVPASVEASLGQSLQAASTAWSQGDPVGAISNVINIPGAMVNGFLSGPNGKTGVLGEFLNTGVLKGIVPGLAKSIVAPNAQNIATGGSLQAALQGFGSQLINGWPSLSNAVSGISTGLTTLLQNVSSQMPSLLSSFGATLATNIGLLISNLLKLL